MIKRWEGNGSRCEGGGGEVKQKLGKLEENMRIRMEE